MIPCLECGALAPLGKPCPECGRLNTETMTPCQPRLSIAINSAAPNSSAQNDSTPNSTALYNTPPTCATPGASWGLGATAPLPQPTPSISSTSPLATNQLPLLLPEDEEPVQPSWRQKTVQWVAICLLVSFSSSFLLPACARLGFTIVPPQAKCQNNITELANALERFSCTHHGRYPQDLQQLTVGFSPVLSELPACPKHLGHKVSYRYEFQQPQLGGAANTPGAYTLTCLGNHASVFSRSLQAGPVYSTWHGFVTP